MFMAKRFMIILEPWTVSISESGGSFMFRQMWTQFE